MAPTVKQQRWKLLSYAICGCLLTFAAGYYFKYLGVNFDSQAFAPLGGAIAGLWSLYQWLEGRLGKVESDYEKAVDRLEGKIVRLEGLVSVLREQINLQKP